MSRLDEKRFKALGQEWAARFDFNATCAIEAETGKGFWEFVSPLMIKLDPEDAMNPGKVMTAMAGLRQSDIRLIMFHALSGAHDVTIEQVGEIIQDIGSAEAMGVVAWALGQAMGGEGDEGNAKAAPTENRTQRKAAAKLG